VLDRIGGKLRLLLHAALAGATLLMMLVTVVDVAGRYLFSAPLQGAYELIELSLGLMIMSGMSLVSAQGSHISVSLIESQRTRGWYPLLQRGIELFCLVVSCGIAYALFLRAGHLFATREHSHVLRLLVWPVVGTLAFLWVGVAVVHVARLAGWRRDSAARPDIL
jgi:TRAP-type C4-dicarboxylate transport system permease small subunit